MGRGTNFEIKASEPSNDSLAPGEVVAYIDMAFNMLVYKSKTAAGVIEYRETPLAAIGVPAAPVPDIHWKGDGIVGIADGAGLQTWPDSSGNARVAAQATAVDRPLYRINRINGKPAVLFNGANRFMDSTELAAINELTLFMVAGEFPGGGNTGYVMSIADQNTFGNDAIISGFAGDILEVFNNPRLSMGAQPPAAPGYAAYGLVRSQAGVVTTTYRNGVQVATAAQALASPAGHICLGAHGGLSFWAGALAEVLIYFQVLTLTQIGLVFRGLNKKYALYLD